MRTLGLHATINKNAPIKETEEYFLRLDDHGFLFYTPPLESSIKERAGETFEQDRYLGAVNIIEEHIRNKRQGCPNRVHPVIRSIFRRPHWLINATVTLKLFAVDYPVISVDNVQIIKEFSFLIKESNTEKPVQEILAGDLDGDSLNSKGPIVQTDATKYVSERDILLFCQEPNTYGKPTVTMEDYMKWYGVHILHSDGRVESVSPDLLSEIDDKLGGGLMGDHNYHPHLLRGIAKHIGGVVDYRAEEAVTGRWVNEILDGKMGGR